MQTINIDEAKNRFSKLVDTMEEGEIVVIVCNGKPTVKLVPLDYGERDRWSANRRQVRSRRLILDRSDVLPAPERDLF